MPNRSPRSEVSEVVSAVNSSPVSQGARAFEPPRYGQAAAIHALYQFGFTVSDEQKPKPRKPGGGKLVRALEGAVRFLRAPLPVPA